MIKLDTFDIEKTSNRIENEIKDTSKLLMWNRFMVDAGILDMLDAIKKGDRPSAQKEEALIRINNILDKVAREATNIKNVLDSGLSEFTEHDRERLNALFDAEYPDYR